MDSKLIIKGKYVMTPEGPILFPNAFNHSFFRYANVTSAGQFNIYLVDGDEILVIALGGSLTLGISSDEMDAERIKQYFYEQFKCQRQTKLSLDQKKRLL